MQPQDLADLDGTKLSSWLSSKYRTNQDPPVYTKFDAIEINEDKQITAKVKLYLKKLVLDALFDLELLREVVAILGWKEAERMVSQRTPKGLRLRRGDFGETITNSLLQEFFLYQIPVQKLRYRIDSDESLPGTDSMALNVQEGRITQACFVESKTRSTAHTTTAVDGYDQLMADFGTDFSEITDFVLCRLKEMKHELLRPFLDYMRDRKTTSMESLRLGLVWDAAKWSETNLKNLERDRDSGNPQLVVLLIRIPNLRELIDEVYGLIGVKEILEEDD
jgi:hypothetical protein